MRNELNVRLPSVDAHKFSMVPRADIPRSVFRMQFDHKTTINASNLTPIFVQEVLPGDMFKCIMHGFVRLSTPLFPIMDNMRLDTFFFFVPNRLVWKHWAKFCGEQDNPGDSISFSIPQLTCPLNGYAEGSIFDYFGLPCAGQVIVGNSYSHSVLPLRAYNLIYHQWFRDQNLINATFVVGGTTASNGPSTDDDGPDFVNQYTLFPRGKRHDYFTSALPFVQKGTAVGIPLGTSATVKVNATDLTSVSPSVGVTWALVGGTAKLGANLTVVSDTTATGMLAGGTAAGTRNTATLYPTNLYADLSTATTATINALRLAFQTQKLLERDARGGTRYTEIVRSHFGVMSPDSRLQRAEFLGGGSSPVNITPVAQTGGTGASGTTTALGSLAAIGTSVARDHAFRQSFTEHGHIIGLASITADLSYPQGLRRMWSRLTRYDFYWPAFATLGEQSVLNKEIYLDGSANDALTFGYQERWAEYRFMPSMCTGAFRSRFATPLDAWHLVQNFAALPVLNAGFVNDLLLNTLDRNLAAGATARTNNEQFLCDFFFDMQVARPMPMYSVPGLIDHF